MSVRRRVSVLLLLLAARGAPAVAQDWDVAPRPTRPRPAPRRPAPRPTAPRPATTAPPPPAAGPSSASRDAAIGRLVTLVLDDREDGVALIPTLLRLARARDGSSDPLLLALEARRASAPPGAVDLVRGEVLRDAGRFDEAVAALTRSTADRPSRASAWRSLAALHRQLDHVADARSAYERALSLSTARDARAEVLRALMDLAVAAGDVERARAAQRDLTGLLPGSASVRRELADLLVSRQRWPEAVVELEALARSLAGDLRVQPAVLRDLGRAQLRAGMLDEAEASLRRAASGASSSPAIERDVYESLAEIHQQRQDLATWVASLEALPGGGAERWAFLGRQYAALGQSDRAVRALRRALAQRPRDLDLHVQLVQALTQAGRVDDALAARRTLVAAVPGEVRYAVDLADELQRAGRNREALAVLTAASGRLGSDAEGHSQLAQAFSRLGAAALATREAELVVRLDPGDPAALEALGERFWERDDPRRALAVWERIRARARHPADGHRALGEVLARHDLLSEAITAFRQALAARPGDVTAARLLAQTQEQAQDLPGAVESWRQVIALPGADAELRAEARTRIANLWNLQGRLPEYAARLEETLRQDPAAVDAALDLAEVYARLHRPADRERTLERVVALRPADARSWLAVERSRAERGDLAGAIEALQRVVAIDPRRGRELYPRLARHALALHRDADAVAFAARAVELNPDDAAGHRELGDLYRARGELDRALGAYRRALALNDRDFESALRVADLHLARGESVEAVDRLRSVVRRSTDDDLVGRAGRIAVQVALATHGAEALAADLAAASAAAPGRAVLRRLQSELFLGWLRPEMEALGDANPARVAEARAHLQRLSARAVRPLLDVVAEPGAERQRLAVRALGALGVPDAVQSLLDVATGDHVDESTRHAALQAAAACADARSVPALVTMLRGADETAATLAAWALARQPGPAAELALREAVRRTDAGEAPVVAALSLAARRSLAARPLLESVLAAAPDGPMRAAALVAWADLSPPTVAAARLVAEESRGPWSRAAALGAMGPLAARQPSLRPVLWRAAFASPATPAPPGLPIARIAATALARSVAGGGLLEGPAWRGYGFAEEGASLLTSLLAPPASAGDGVPALERDEALVVGALRDALGDPLRREAAMSALDATALLPPVATVASTQAAPSARSAVDRVLRELAPDLAAAWAHTAPGGRAPLLRVLARVHHPVATEVLRQAARLAEPDLRHVAERALRAEVDEAAGFPHDAASWSDRLQAVEALGRSDSVASTRALADAAVRDPSGWVRRAALHLLEGRDDALVGETLTQVRDHDPDPVLRAEATESLRRRSP